MCMYMIACSLTCYMNTDTGLLDTIQIQVLVLQANECSKSSVKVIILY